MSEIKPEPVAAPAPSKVNPMVSRFLNMGISMATLEKLTGMKLKHID